MTYDGSNRKQVRQRDKEAKIAEANRIAYTKRIMSELSGREWMYDLLSRCNVFHTPFVRGAMDVTAFNCGTQNLGLQLFADVVGHTATEYVLMMQEANIKELLNERRNSDNRSPADSTVGEPARDPDPGRDVEGSRGEYDPFGSDSGDETTTH